MANLVDLAAEVKNDGYSQVNAEAKVCQDIVLKAISESSLSRNVTIWRNEVRVRIWVLLIRQE